MTGSHLVAGNRYTGLVGDAVLRNSDAKLQYSWLEKVAERRFVIGWRFSELSQFLRGKTHSYCAVPGLNYSNKFI